MVEKTIFYPGRIFLLFFQENIDLIFLDQTPDKQAELFHNFLRIKLDQYFPEKTVKISSLDKKWFSPPLKQLHRRMQRAYHKDRNSIKFQQLK